MEEILESSYFLAHVTSGKLLSWLRFFGEGNSNPLQYSCLENSVDGGTWWFIVHRVAKSRTQLSDFTSLLAVFGTMGIKMLMRSPL